MRKIYNTIKTSNVQATQRNKCCVLSLTGTLLINSFSRSYLFLLIQQMERHFLIFTRYMISIMIAQNTQR